MSSVVFRRSRGIYSSLQRCYSASAVPLTSPIDTNTPPQATIKAPEDVKVSKVNGYMVASLENHSTLSSVSVFMRAGSRYESYDKLGVTHLLRKCAFLGNDDRSAFRISRETDMIGASLDATATREYMIYSSRFLRGNATQMMDTLGSVITYSQLKSWEVEDSKKTLPLDLTQVQACPTSIILEGLHRVAFRDGLCNSLYCPPHNISKFTSDDLQSYMKENFVPESTTVVGVGVSHSELVNGVQNSFSSANARANSQTQTTAEYVGGELRLPSDSAHTYAALLCKGASTRGAQTDLLAAGVLQQMLGAELQGSIKWGSNTARLSKAGALVTDLPFSAAALNLNYSDSGLFGVYVVCEPGDSEKLLKATLKEFSAVAMGDVSNEDLTRAKNQLKSRYVMNTETQGSLMEDIASQVELKGSFTPLKETLAQVDTITKDDVIGFARAVCATKASYVSHGNLSNTPRLDQLLAELLLK